MISGDIIYFISVAMKKVQFLQDEGSVYWMGTGKLLKAVQKLPFLIILLLLSTSSVVKRYLKTSRTHPRMKRSFMEPSICY